MSITPTPATLGASLFGGMFGNAQTSANSLFGMLISLLGQNLGGTQDPGQLLTQTQLLQPGTLVANEAILADGTLMAFPTDPAGLLALLNNLAASPGASPELQALLDGLGSPGTSTTINPDAASLDLARLETLRNKFAALDNDQQQALLGEMAALLLLMPPIQPASPPVALGPDGNNSAAAPVTATEADSTGLSALDAANDLLLHSQAKDSAKNQAKDQAFAALASALQSKTDLQQTADNDASTIAADARSRALNAEAQARTQQAISGTGPDASVLSATSGGISAEARSVRRMTDNQAGQTHDAGKITAPGDPKVTPAIPVHAESSRPVTQAASATIASGHDTTAQTTGKDLGPAALLPPAEGARDARGASFQDHLSKVNLNRTGAHIPVSEQIAVQMTSALKNGHDHMTIRLQPADLGHIEIKLDLSSDGRVTARFSVDQPATLDLLQRDRNGLERALSDAGLKTDTSTLSFNLRDNGSGQRGPASDNPQQNSSNDNGAPGQLPEDNAANEALPAGMIEMIWHISPDRVDVRI